MKFLLNILTDENGQQFTQRDIQLKRRNSINLLARFMCIVVLLGFQSNLEAQQYPQWDKKNIAQFKPVKQSSTDHKSGAHRAVDGITNGNWNNASVSHTTFENNPWLEIDLLDEYEITDITLHNRTDCCSHQMANLTISVSDNPMEGGLKGEVFANEPGQVGNSKKYSNRKKGRYVKVQMNKTDQLMLAEVVINGELVKRIPRLNDNIALGKPARQSSTFEGYTPANLANDGNTEGNFHLGSVSSTNVELGAWWEVDLGAMHEVYEVVIYNRTDCCQDRLSDFTIRYSEDPINEKGDGFVLKESTQHPRIFEKFSPGNNKGKVNARYIRVALNGSNILSLAEVQVKGSLPGIVTKYQAGIKENYWTYTMKTNTSKYDDWETTITNSIEKSAGYQLEKTQSNEIGASAEFSVKGQMGVPEVFSIEQSLTIGANVNFASGQTNTSNQNQAVNSSIEDRIKIPARSVLYFFTEWEEEKAKTTIAYDGKNWPYTAITAIKWVNTTKVVYGIDEEIAPELKQYKSSQPIPDSIYQKILAHSLGRKVNQEKIATTNISSAGTTSNNSALDNNASSNSSGSTNDPNTSGSTSSEQTNSPDPQTDNTQSSNNTPNSDQYCRIQNNWYQDTYINNQSGTIGIGPIQPNWWSAQWKIVPVHSGWVRIQNRWYPDQYLHIQNGSLEVGPIDNNWASAMWKLEPAHGDWVRIQNSWQTDKYIHNDSGKVKAGPIQPNWASALWRLQSE